MSRRSRQNAVIWIVTGLFIGAGIYFGPYRSDFRSFFWICALYALFLALFTAVSRLGVPKQMRKRPEIPADFHAIRTGPVSSRIQELISCATLLESRLNRKFVHQFHEISRPFPNGEWICRFEIADNHVLARSIMFKSRFSPALDYGESQGSGIYISAGVD